MLLFDIPCWTTALGSRARLMSQKSAFSERGHVVYQMEGNERQNNMQLKIKPLCKPDPGKNYNFCRNGLLCISF